MKPRSAMDQALEKATAISRSKTDPEQARAIARDLLGLLREMRDAEAAHIAVFARWEASGGDVATTHALRVEYAQLTGKAPPVSE